MNINRLCAVQHFLHNIQESRYLAQTFVKAMYPGNVATLQGDLGAVKTFL